MRAMLFNEPHPTDLEGWKQHLEWLRAEPEFVGRDNSIEGAEQMIDILENHAAQERAVEAR